MNLTFSHIFREGNAVADFFANQAISDQSSKEITPEHIVGKAKALIRMDKLNVPYIRNGSLKWDILNQIQPNQTAIIYPEEHLRTLKLDYLPDYKKDCCCFEALKKSHPSISLERPKPSFAWISSMSLISEMVDSNQMTAVSGRSLKRGTLNQILSDQTAIISPDAAALLPLLHHLCPCCRTYFCCCSAERSTAAQPDFAAIISFVYAEVALNQLDTLYCSVYENMAVTLANQPLKYFHISNTHDKQRGYISASLNCYWLLQQHTNNADPLPEMTCFGEHYAF
ncbi:hypothetical protein Salat_1591300 [Sesamum alatum]|uniref:Uncharacterized protein n=1 Tax=Sesamum alatum TaxID=300844 RepID=A0AAE2CJ85_9LAMI|nr:hypothetical protein Salat_1591300 [Sesamum alatum]